jgi:hypothetical protein
MHPCEGPDITTRRPFGVRAVRPGERRLPGNSSPLRLEHADGQTVATLDVLGASHEDPKDLDSHRVHVRCRGAPVAPGRGTPVLGGFRLPEGVRLRAHQCRARRGPCGAVRIPSLQKQLGLRPRSDLLCRGVRRVAARRGGDGLRPGRRGHVRRLRSSVGRTVHRRPGLRAWVYLPGRHFLRVRQLRKGPAAGCQ